MNFKLLTFNIHHGRGMDKRLDLDRIIRIIEDSNADIIGLNEVDKRFSKRSEFMDQAEFIANGLNMRYVFGPTLALKWKNNVRQYGNALLTRLPIVSSINHPLDFLPKIVEGRASLEVRVEIEDQVISANVTHLSLAPILHTKQTAFILNLVENQRNPSIIMGDWNMQPYTKNWRNVVTQLKDTWNERGNQLNHGYTYPSHQPRKKLDYIFVSKEFEILDSEVISNHPMASDHLPLLATIKLNQP